MAGIWDLSYCGADRWHLRLYVENENFALRIRQVAIGPKLCSKNVAIAGIA